MVTQIELSITHPDDFYSLFVNHGVDIFSSDSTLGCYLFSDQVEADDPIELLH